MPLIVKDRVKAATLTAGTGTITLTSAAAGYQPFSVLGDGNTTYYAITDATTGDWEVGLGTYTLSGNTLARTTVLDSSNSGAAVNFAANVKDVFVTYPAGKAVLNGGALGTPASGTLTNCTFPTLNQNTSGTAAGLSATLAVGSGGTGATTASGARTNLGVAIGTDVQAYDADLTTWAGVTPGTGVATALAVNVGSAGATVVNGGALGTPASGTLTNCTFPTLNQNTSGTAAGLSATLAVGSGGTGATTLTANNVLLGNGTSALQAVAPGTSGNVLTSNGTTWASSAVAPSTQYGLFRKADPTIVAWSKTGAFAVSTATTLYVEVNGTTHTIAASTAVTMPSATTGTDYAIWCTTAGALQATTDHTNPPSANARKVGGFHYAPGGNATAQAGGDTTPAINAYSFWDLKFKPSCPDPRGMTLVGGGYWVDIYLTGVDAITNGSSKYNVTIADGSSPPKVPTMFGGNGTTTYGTLTWFESVELATAFGKRLISQIEFMSAAYGTTEASSVGPDQVSTVLNAAYTSKWGVIQSTGVMYIWGADRGGAYYTGGWNANTEGRGYEYNAPTAVLLGAPWNYGVGSGSRCSDWASAASGSYGNSGSRFAANHIVSE